MPRLQRIASYLLSGALLAPVAAVADSVYLKNGQIFDGVEAVVDDDYVRIDLAIGSVRLPMSQVDRVEEVDSTIGEYRERQLRLGRDAADAAGWLELAQWARARDFSSGAQKAAVQAARLDPALPGLDSMMASIGYVFDDTAREWVPYDEGMRRQGLVEDRGEWVTPAERRERSRSRVEVIAEDDSHSRADDHLDKALDILAAAVNKPEAPPATINIVNQPGGAGAGFGYFPGFIGGFVGAPIVDGGIGLDRGAIIRAEAQWSAVAGRQPASFIPLPSTVPRHIDPVTHRFVR